MVSSSGRTARLVCETNRQWTSDYRLLWSRILLLAHPRAIMVGSRAVRYCGGDGLSALAEHFPRVWGVELTKLSPSVSRNRLSLPGWLWSTPRVVVTPQTWRLRKATKNQMKPQGDGLLHAHHWLGIQTRETG